MPHNETTGLTPVTSRLLEARLELQEKIWGKNELLYSHIVLTSVGLPYKDLGKVRSFQRTSGKTALLLEAGSLPTGNGGFVEMGLPFGSRARMLLFYLTSAAVKTQNPIVEVEDTFTSFARSLGLSTGGRELKSLREQVLRMSCVSMSLAKSYGSHTDVFQGKVFSKLRCEMPDSPSQLALWTSFVEFSPDFFTSLSKNAVPLRREAIHALSHSSRALDLYAWLAARLCRVNDSNPVRLKWTTLRWQFGNSSLDMRSFKTNFKKALKAVLFVYPEARVEPIYGGILLKRSPPPVPRIQKNKGLLY